jgi:glycosyltransferase involved in cell wall biosynthesis
VRVALVALHFAEYASRLALALAQDHSVLLVLRTDNATSELSESLREALDKNVKLVLIEHRQLRQIGVISAAISLVRVVQSFRPDVVHFQEYPVDYLAWAGLWLMQRFPSVVTIHDHESHSGLDSKSPWRFRYYRKLLRQRADRIIVHGETIRLALANDLTISNKPVFSIMHGALGTDGAGCELTHAPDIRTLLFFGRIEAYKGLPVLLDAIDILNAEGKVKVRLIIGGKGSALEPLRARIVANPNIELIDRYISADEIPALFHRSGVVVLPYLDATQSGVAAIAFAYGRPVIASNTGALPEVVRNNETGLLVPPADARSLAQSIHKLVSDRDLWTNLAVGALRLAHSDLSWPRIAILTGRVYETLANDV